VAAKLKNQKEPRNCRGQVEKRDLWCGGWVFNDDSQSKMV